MSFYTVHTISLHSPPLDKSGRFVPGLVGARAAERGALSTSYALRQRRVWTHGQVKSVVCLSRDTHVLGGRARRPPAQYLVLFPPACGRDRHEKNANRVARRTGVSTLRAHSAKPLLLLLGRGRSGGGLRDSGGLRGDGRGDGRRRGRDGGRGRGCGRGGGGRGGGASAEVVPSGRRCSTLCPRFGT